MSNGPKIDNNFDKFVVSLIIIDTSLIISLLAAPTNFVPHNNKSRVIILLTLISDFIV